MFGLDGTDLLHRKEYVKKFNRRSVSFVSIPEHSYVSSITSAHRQSISDPFPRGMSQVNGVLPAPVNGSEKTTEAASRPEDMELLAKLEEENRKLEMDNRSRSSLTPPKIRGHSRNPSQASISSETSAVSQCSFASGVDIDTSSPEDLWQLWSKLVSDWESNFKKREKFVKSLVYRGVPQYFRGLAWTLMANANDPSVKDLYIEYLKQTSPTEKAIRRDITRTYPDHSFFKQKNGLGQESLFNVMKAYSLHDREVGYCQGSCFIVGLLLMQMPEEEAFAVLVKLMLNYRMRELFKPSMAELGLCMHQLDFLLQEQLPQLHMHFQSQNLNVSTFASSWFLTVFATSLPLSLTCRIFDIFLLEGSDFSFRVALALLQIQQEDLLASDMEGMIKLLQKDSLTSKFEGEADVVIATAINIKLPSKKLKKLEKEYTAMKSKENEDQVELRRLRTENRLLRQRIENLEKETIALADRLVQDQFRCAQQQEQLIGLRKDLSNARLGNELQRSNSSSSSGSLSAAGAGNPEADQLRREVKQLRTQDVEHQSAIRQLRDRIQQLEKQNEDLVEGSSEPSQEMQSLQEQLIASKLREAEANLAIKELQHSILELEKRWNTHLQRHGNQATTPAPSSKAAKAAEVKQMAEEAMSLRLKEARYMAEIKDMKQLYMEMETKNHIHERHIKRLEEEVRRLNDAGDAQRETEKNLHQTIESMERQIADLNTKLQEGEMMRRLKDAENSHSTAEMRQRIAELEIENQELQLSHQLKQGAHMGDLEDQIADLEDEVQQLRLSSGTSPVKANFHINSIEDSETESEDLELTVTNSHLKLSDSSLHRAASPDTHYSSTDTLLNPSSPIGSPPRLLDDQSSHNTTRSSIGSDRDSNKTPTGDSTDYFLYPISLETNGDANEQTDSSRNEHTTKESEQNLVSPDSSRSRDSQEPDTLITHM